MSSLHAVDKNIPILVVDEAPRLRKTMKNALVQLGFKNIQEAEDGPAALEKLRAESFKLIFSDRTMPNMTGMELLREIRSDQDLQTLPFVMLSGDGRKELVVEAIQAGVSNYMVKPFTVDDLKSKLEMISSKLR